MSLSLKCSSTQVPILSGHYFAYYCCTTPLILVGSALLNRLEVRSEEEGWGDPDSTVTTVLRGVASIIHRILSVGAYLNFII